MLAGREDVEPLAFYNPRMKEFADDGKVLRGAYGFRWRRHFQFDQLYEIVEELRKDPGSRRVVLQMWSCLADLGNTGTLETDGTITSVKDKPCNTHAYLSINDAQQLDMMVCNRSNDLVWGMLGANVVQFSMLQEYLAIWLDLKVGMYHQVTNNLHVYTERWKPDEWLQEYERTMHSLPRVSYQGAKVLTPPLVYTPKVFNLECGLFIDDIDGKFTEPFLCRVAQPMCLAFRRHKLGQYHGDEGAYAHMEKVWSWDWKLAGTEWLQRREKAK